MNNLPLPEVKEINEEPINQWHEQLLRQTDEDPKSSKFWNDVPTPRRECVVYDWPDSHSI